MQPDKNAEIIYRTLVIVNKLVPLYIYVCVFVYGFAVALSV